VKQPYRYIGVFLSAPKVLEAASAYSSNRLYRLIEHPHITFAFRPEKADESLFGLPVSVKVTGYGNNGENEGLRVELCQADERIRAMWEAIALPHITVSVSQTGESVNTRWLSFAPVEDGPVLHGIFGGCTEEREVILESIVP